MKKNYATPTMIAEIFEPTEYVAACYPKTYLEFTCLPGEVYLETNGISDLQTSNGTNNDGSAYNSDQYIGKKTCNSTHTIRSTILTTIINEFAPAYVITSDNNTTRVKAGKLDWFSEMHYGTYVEKPNYS